MKNRGRPRALISYRNHKSFVGKIVKSHGVEYIVISTSKAYVSNYRGRIKMQRTDGTYQMRHLSFSDFNRLID